MENVNYDEVNENMQRLYGGDQDIEEQINRLIGPRPVPYTVDHQDGKPNTQMITRLMNIKDLDATFKSKCVEAMAVSNWKWIERRIKNQTTDDVSDLILMLRDQIKRDKKYLKSLKK